MSRLSTFLIISLAMSWIMLFMLFLDNRMLADLAKERSEMEWARPETVHKLTDACSRLSYINKVDQALLFKAKEFLDEIEQIKNHNKASQPGRGETRRRSGDGQVRSVSGDADKRSDAGVGGPG